MEKGRKTFVYFPVLWQRIQKHLFCVAHYNFCRSVIRFGIHFLLLLLFDVVPVCFLLYFVRCWVVNMILKMNIYCDFSNKKFSRNMLFSPSCARHCIFLQSHTTYLQIWCRTSWKFWCFFLCRFSLTATGNKIPVNSNRFFSLSSLCRFFWPCRCLSVLHKCFDEIFFLLAAVAAG